MGQASMGVVFLAERFASGPEKNSGDYHDNASPRNAHRIMRFFLVDSRQRKTIS